MRKSAHLGMLSMGAIIPLLLAEENKGDGYIEYSMPYKHLDPPKEEVNKNHSGAHKYYLKAIREGDVLNNVWICKCGKRL